MSLLLQTGTGNEILRKISKPISEITKKTLKLIKEMEKTMDKEKGIGLAAPQVGINERLILVTIDNKKIVPMINPEIIEMSEENCIDEEGCLSLPGEFAPIIRAKEITVRYQTPKKQTLTVNLADFNARVVQHEVDHLNGVLFTDYLNLEDRIMQQLQSMKDNETVK